MKALTISQPYASLIASGEKWIENRSWPTSYCGPLAIHAGKGLQYLDRDEIKEYPTGCVIAVGQLIHCISIHDLRASGRGDLRLIPNTKRLLTYGRCFEHEHAEGPYCWILEDVQPIDPVPCRGAQNLWNWERPS
jgi:hypothetical protein